MSGQLRGRLNGRLRECAVALAYGIMRPLVPRLPRRMFYRTAAAIGGVNYLLHRDLRVAVRRNMRTVYAGVLNDAQVERLVRGYFASRTQYVLESLLVGQIAQPRYESWFRISGREHIDRVIAEKRGAVVPLIHFGPFTLAGAKFAAWGLPVTDIAQGVTEASSSKVARHMNRDRYASWEAGGGALVERSGFLRQALVALRRGEALSVFFDAPPTATSVMTEGWFVGRWVELHRGPATVSLKTGSPLLLMGSYRDADDRICLEIAGTVEPVHTGDTDADIQATIQAVADYMSVWVHRHPAQWIMWKELHARERPVPAGATTTRAPSAPETTLLPSRPRR